MAHFCFYNDTDVLFFVFIRIQASFIQTCPVMITLKASERVSNRVQQLLFLFVFFFLFMCCCYNIKPALQCVFVMFRWMHVLPYETIK